jgi:hypothetical protein
VAAFKALLLQRTFLRDRAAMLWQAKVRQDQLPSGKLKRGEVNKMKRENFLKVMRVLKKEGTELKKGQTQETFRCVHD